MNTATWNYLAYAVAMLSGLLLLFTVCKIYVSHRTIDLGGAILAGFGVVLIVASLGKPVDNNGSHKHGKNDQGDLSDQDDQDDQDQLDNIEQNAEDAADHSRKAERIAKRVCLDELGSRNPALCDGKKSSSESNDATDGGSSPSATDNNGASTKRDSHPTSSSKTAGRISS